MHVGAALDGVLHSGPRALNVAVVPLAASLQLMLDSPI